MATLSKRKIHLRSLLTIASYLLAIWMAFIAFSTVAQTPPDSPQKKSDSGDDKANVAGKDGTSMPSCYYMPMPPATKEARDANFAGKVLVEGIVQVDGRITNVRVIKSVGLGLDESVLKTMKTWKCKPAVRDGKPVPAKVPFEILFRAR